MYKTIALHINDEQRVHRLVTVGTALAQRFDAHLTAVCVLPHVPTPPIPLPLAKSLSGQIATAYRDEAARAQQAFETAVKGLTVVPEWRLVHGRQLSYCEDLLEHVRASDLIVASQRNSDWGYASIFDVPEELALGAGRPVLIVPLTEPVLDIGRRITVAWNGKREAARAVGDALALLRQAEHVRVLWVNPQDDATGGDLATVDICAALARHGVKCDGAQTRTTSKGSDVGQELLQQAAEHKSDLLVMGCYGHPRIRQLILGGATRHILRHMNLPVLMSH